MSKHVIIIAHGWPDNKSGYGIATSCSITAISLKFNQICYVAITETNPTLNLQRMFPYVDFKHLSIKRHSLVIRFLKSLLSTFPACVQQFRDKSLYISLSNICEEKRSKYGVLPVVIFEGIPIAIFQNYLKKRDLCLKTIVRSHDVLFEAFSNFQKQGNFIVRIAWSLEVAKIRFFEKGILEMANLFWPITTRDSDIYKKKYGVKSNGVFGVYIDIPEKLEMSKVDFNTIISLVNVDYRKQGGLRMFIEQVWPRIKDKRPNSRLILGGYNTERFNSTLNGIQGLGFIEDPEKLLENGFIFLNSQDSGSGIKIKSLVAMAWGKLLVTTRVGVQGIHGIPGEHYLCGDEPVELVRLIIEAMEKPEENKNIVNNGYDFVKKNYCKNVFMKNCLPLIERM